MKFLIKSYKYSIFKFKIPNDFLNSNTIWLIMKISSNESDGIPAYVSTS